MFFCCVCVCVFVCVCVRVHLRGQVWSGGKYGHFKGNMDILLIMCVYVCTYVCGCECV